MNSLVPRGSISNTSEVLLCRLSRFSYEFRLRSLEKFPLLWSWCLLGLLVLDHKVAFSFDACNSASERDERWKRCMLGGALWPLYTRRLESEHFYLLSSLSLSLSFSLLSPLPSLPISHLLLCSRIFINSHLLFYLCLEGVSLCLFKVSKGVFFFLQN